MDMKIELVPVPVTDVDKAIHFYVDQVGFVLDHDIAVSDAIRFVQLTPPGSACSIVLGKGITEMTPGSQKGLQVVVNDVAAVRDMLVEKGVQATEVEHLDWGSFTYFEDPDGNSWAVQQM
jgi:catechol 2,3-dioxygenase-like lactoylglutathione lyase family enzyme